jgi:hypothetical protein
MAATLQQPSEDQLRRAKIWGALTLLFRGTMITLVANDLKPLYKVPAKKLAMDIIKYTAISALADLSMVRAAPAFIKIK